MSEQQAKRGAGRPPIGKGTERIDLTLSKEVVTFLRSMPSGERSAFVDKWIKENPNYTEWVIAAIREKREREEKQP